MKVQIKLPIPLYIAILMLVVCFAACKQQKKNIKTKEQLEIDSTVQKLDLQSYSKPDSVQAACEALLQQAKHIKYAMGQSQCLTTLSNIQNLKGNYDSSIIIATNAMEMVDSAQNPKQMAELFNKVGICYDYKSDYKKAMDNYNKALFFFGAAKDSNGIVRAKNNIGLIYQNAKDFKRSKLFFDECLTIAKEKKYTDLEIMALSNLAAVEIEMGESHLALGHFKQVLKNDVASGNETYISYSYNNIAEAYKQLKQYDSAEHYYKLSIGLKEKLDAQVALLNSHKAYADMLIDVGKLTDAKNYLDKSFTIAKKAGAKEYLQACYQLQAKLAEKNNDYKKAFEATNLANAMKDSIANAKFKTELVAKEKDFELNLKNTEIQKEKLELVKIKSQQIIFLLALGLFAFLSVSLLVLFRKQKNLNRLQLIQQQKLEVYNKQLTEQKIKIEEGLETKSRFLSFMAHEIRNPLSGIMGLTDLLIDSKPTDIQREYLDYLQKSSSNLLQLLNEVLDYQKLVSGKMELNKVKFSLKDIASQTHFLYSSSIKEKNLLFQLNYDEKIPTILFGDPIRLTQIIGNLINNAIKFTPQNGIVTVNILLKETLVNHAKIYFAISDTGMGIDKEDQEKIFELYHQGKPNKGKIGTGLGLNIVKNLLDLMGSKIQVKSEEDQGSTFTFEVVFEVPQ
jgi:signal transduction histidine kinase/tetratricopeptide (TPR) repeat protein